MKVDLRTMLLFIVGVLLFSFSSVWAEEQEESKGFEVYSLGEIVVKGENQGVRSITNITELTTEDFESTNAYSVPEALIWAPGVVVTTGTKNQANISIHGFDQKRILTLIDGVPYYETNYGYLDLNQIALDSVARIDVVKGAASVLYGANALGGVINIITKKPTESPSFSVNTEYGVDGLEDPYKFSVSHGRKVGIFNYFLSYSHKEWDSWEMPDDFEPEIGTIRVFPPAGPPGPRTPVLIEDGGDRNNSDYETDNLWAKFGIEPSDDTEIYANMHYVKTEKGIPPNIESIRVFLGDYFSQLFRWDNYEDSGIDLSGKHQFNDQWNIKTTLFYHKHKDDMASYLDVDYTTRIGLSNYKDYILGGMVQTEFKPVDWDVMRFGVNYRKDNHEQRADKSLPYAESSAYTGSVSFENESSFIESRLSVVVGASYDWYDVDDAEDDRDNDGNIRELVTPSTMKEFNPMIGASYEINDMFRAFASIARKTRFPTLREIYAGDVPNMDLEAETSINYTAGIEMVYEDILNIGIMPFFYDISDYIVREDHENPFDQYQNYGDVNLSGVELNLVYTPLANFMVKLGYTYNHSENRSDVRGSKHMEYIPEHKIDFAMQYTIPELETRFNLTTAYVGESYDQVPAIGDPPGTVKNDAFTLFNAKITQPFLDHFEAYLSVNNILDKNYEPEKAFPIPGRSIWLGATYRY
jgi:iron complex outermembrane receptor protein